MKTITENVDLLVAGGGTAGHIAAIQGELFTKGKAAEGLTLVSWTSNWNNRSKDNT